MASSLPDTRYTGPVLVLLVLTTQHAFSILNIHRSNSYESFIVKSSNDGRLINAPYWFDNAYPLPRPLKRRTTTQPTDILVRIEVWCYFSSFVILIQVYLFQKLFISGNIHHFSSNEEICAWCWGQNHLISRTQRLGGIKASQQGVESGRNSERREQGIVPYVGQQQASHWREDPVLPRTQGVFSKLVNMNWYVATRALIGYDPCSRFCRLLF